MQTRSFQPWRLPFILQFFESGSHTFGTFCPEVRCGTGDGDFHIRPTLRFAKSCAKGCPFDVPIERSAALSMQKTDYQLPADSPSFVVIFRLPTAQPEYSSIIPYWVSAFRQDALFVLLCFCGRLGCCFRFCLTEIDAVAGLGRFNAAVQRAHIFEQIIPLGRSARVSGRLLCWRPFGLRRLLWLHFRRWSFGLHCGHDVF